MSAFISWVDSSDMYCMGSPEGPTGWTTQSPQHWTTWYISLARQPLIPYSTSLSCIPTSRNYMYYVTLKRKIWSFPVNLSLPGTNSMGKAWPWVLGLIVQDSPSTNVSSPLKCCHFWNRWVKIWIDSALVRTHLLQMREKEITPA